MIILPLQKLIDWRPQLRHWGPQLAHCGPALGHWAPPLGHWDPPLAHWDPPLDAFLKLQVCSAHVSERLGLARKRKRNENLLRFRGPKTERKPAACLQNVSRNKSCRIQEQCHTPLYKPACAPSARQSEAKLGARNFGGILAPGAHTRAR